MRLITAIIRPHSLDDVKDSVQNAGVEGMTVSEVKGFGRQGGHTETYRGAEYKVDFIPKLKLEILCQDDHAMAVTQAVMTAAKTGKIGDGRIWVTNVETAIRIRTGEADVV